MDLPPLYPEETALLVVDMQNGYCHPEGSLAKGGANTRPQQAIVPATVELVSACRAAGVTIIWVTQEHWADDRTRSHRRLTSHLSKVGAVVALRGTWDAEIVEPLKAEMRPEDPVVRKHRMSAFFNTTLETVLRMLDTRLLIVCGVSTNVCVESTLRDAYHRDYDQILVPECTASSDADLYEATLKKTRKYFGEVAPLAEVVAALAAARATSAV
jgi:ureidoacrylate peracid hydrolase